MLKKQILSTLLFLLVLTFTSCGVNKNNDKKIDDSIGVEEDGNSNNSEDKDIQEGANDTQPIESETDKNVNSYELIQDSYIDKEIKINYPQVTNLSDNNKLNDINELIKQRALKILNDYEGFTDNLTLDISYDIKYKNSNLLSIEYMGVGNVEGGAHPSNIFYTTNININEGKIIKLRDVVNVNEDFIQKFKEGKYVPYDSGLILEDEMIANELNIYSNDDLINYFTKADEVKNNELYVFGYFTKDTLGISINVSHAIGDHVEFEIRYEDLDGLKTKHDIWKAIKN